jgi:LysR family nitrogen assimilation transcriptional regulator
MRVRRFAEGGCHRSIVLCRSVEATLSPAAAKAMSLVEEAARSLVVRGHWLGAHLD